MTRLLNFGLALCLALCGSLALARTAADDEKTVFKPEYPDPSPIDVCPSQTVGYRSLLTLDFTDPNTTLDGWEARDGVTLERGERTLKFISKTHDPYCFSPMIPTLLANKEVRETQPGRILVKMKIRHEIPGLAQIFSAEEAAPDYNEGNSTIFPLEKDSEFHEYVVPLDVGSPLLRLRLDIGGDEGFAEIERIELIQVVFQPVKFGVFAQKDGELEYELVNNELAPKDVLLIVYGLGSRPTANKATLPCGRSAQTPIKLPKNRAFGEVEITAAYTKTVDGATRRFFTFNEAVADKGLAEGEEAPTIASGALKARFAPDASGAEIFLNDKRVAVISPLVCEEGDGADVLESTVDYAAGETFATNSSAAKRLTPVFQSVSDDAREIEFALCDLSLHEYRERMIGRRSSTAPVAPGSVVGSLKFRIDEDKLSFDFDAPRPAHAPVIRVLGTMEQALLPGVEYLEKGEYSSSTADIETKEAVRFAPPIHWITQPFASIITDRGSVSLLYDDPKAQPIFAVPDFIDGDASSSRMNICAKSGTGTIRVGAPEPLENAIQWYLDTRGLPEALTPPRSKEEQEQLNLFGLMETPLNTPTGWVHALSTPGPPYSFKPCYGTDFISAIWEITGKIPETPRIDFGDAHIANYSAMLLTGNGERLVDYLASRRAGFIKSQKKDGSYRYYGKFLKGHHCDYASGDCANKLFWLMDDYRLTGNKDALAAAEKGLAFVNKLRTPAGAQVWELSLHTPDIMGSSRCVLANVLAYEATGKEEYLAAARRWALTGVPFVYLWEDRSVANGEQPMMKYATIAVFGATGWRSPNWMGRPVQWCGLDYAYALILLAKHDKSVDWLKLADGIVTSAECQLYVDEPEFKGLLPDSVQVKTQERYVFAINPTVVHMLRRMIDGKHTNVSVVDVAGRRVVAPYPMKAEGNGVRIKAEQGVDYDIMIDGTDVVKIHSQGNDFYKP